MVHNIDMHVMYILYNVCTFSYLIEVNQVIRPTLNANFRLALPNRLDIGFSSDEKNEHREKEREKVRGRESADEYILYK